MKRNVFKFKKIISNVLSSNGLLSIKDKCIIELKNNGAGVSLHIYFFIY